MSNIDIVNANGKNLKQLICKRCPSKILPPDTGTLEVSSTKGENA